MVASRFLVASISFTIHWLIKQTSFTLPLMHITLELMKALDQDGDRFVYTLYVLHYQTLASKRKTRDIR